MAPKNQPMTLHDQKRAVTNSASRGFTGRQHPIDRARKMPSGRRPRGGILGLFASAAVFESRVHLTSKSSSVDQGESGTQKFASVQGCDVVGSQLARTGLIANRHLRGTGSQSGRLRALPSFACNRGNARLSGRRRGPEGTVFAPVRRHSHGTALHRCAEDHEVRGGRAPGAGHSSGPHTRRRSRKCRFPRRFLDD